MPGIAAGKPQIMTARAKRKRTWMAESSDKTRRQLGMLARRCEPGCRKKKKGFELPEMKQAYLTNSYGNSSITSHL
jgi:hypothetical protein